MALMTAVRDGTGRTDTYQVSGTLAVGVEKRWEIPTGGRETFLVMLRVDPGAGRVTSAKLVRTVDGTNWQTVQDMGPLPVAVGGPETMASLDCGPGCTTAVQVRSVQYAVWLKAADTSTEYTLYVTGGARA